MTDDMTTVLYLDCAAGASGDMLAAALLDVAARAGGRAPRDLLDEVVRPALAQIGIAADVVDVAETRRAAFAALSFTVAERAGFASFGEIIGALDSAELPEPVATTVAGAVARMAGAEREAHGEGGDGHLHELAGLDTAVDLVAVAALVHHLAPARICASPPALGGGSVSTAHGELAVPAPAVVAILRGLPTAGGSPGDGELTTPTGAALLAVLTDGDFGPLPAGRIIASGCGAGARELETRANVLRAIVVEASAAEVAGAAEDAEAEAAGGGGADAPPPPFLLLEANLDDLTPELLAHAAEALRAAGALDVWFTNALMKKGRPGVVLHALVDGGDRDAVAAVLFRETSTFGLRLQPVERLYLDERWEIETVAGHEVRVRLGSLDGELVTVSPEYEDCAAAAAASGLTVKEVVETACAAARHGANAG